MFGGLCLFNAQKLKPAIGINGLLFRIAIKLFCILYIHNFNLEMKWRIRGNSDIPIFVFSGATVITIR